MVDNPNNGGVVLLMAQALFAEGQFGPAANTVQMGMQMLPDERVGQRREALHGDLSEHRALHRPSSRRWKKPATPSPTTVRYSFLLGYHFGYLGYPKQAVRELDKALDIQPQDVGSQKLRDTFASQASMPARVHPAPPEQPQSNAPSGQPAPALPAAPATAVPQT